VTTYENKLLNEKILTNAKMKTIKDQILAKVEAAHQFAVDSPLPAPEDALDDVFSK
jgi:TPP-dependent pyruvate/acetoin dehydrogenase alpha subunit